MTNLRYKNALPLNFCRDHPIHLLCLSPMHNGPNRSENMNANPWPLEKRRHPRIFLGVPVRVHFAGEPKSLTLELADVSMGGSRFHTGGRRPRLRQWVSFGFVTADRLVCAARGRVVRVDASGFALKMECANSDFRSFVEDISGPFRCAA